ncbi:hypothetical protein [Paenibacillus tundrae]|uniref:Phage protein n=1 Tax=Paenibacillus tundrae TaxID=528187 RepID=A0ABT9W625_9BACL|nr:hypothetical protein [Paenibacillus tundrae]MDQ0168699.1 hypothetical protein [Paenibacillus tundrae]
MLNHVKITANYALKSDANNFVVLQRKLVDPTKAPGYKREPDQPAPVIRERWDEIAYYPLTTAGLTALIDSVRMRTATEYNAENLTELGAAIRYATAEIIAAVNAGLAPEFSVKLGA